MILKNKRIYVYNFKNVLRNHVFFLPLFPAILISTSVFIYVFTKPILSK